MTEGSAAKGRESEGRTAGCTSVRIQLFLRPAHSIKVFHDFPRSYVEFSERTRNPRNSACFPNGISSFSSDSPRPTKLNNFSTPLADWCHVLAERRLKVRGFENLHTYKSDKIYSKRLNVFHLLHVLTFSVFLRYMRAVLTHHSSFSRRSSRHCLISF